jgi:hypothetical protein
MTRIAPGWSWWRGAVALAAVAVLVPAWPGRAERPLHGHCRGANPCGKQALSAFRLEYFPKRQKTMAYGDTLDFFNADLATLSSPGHTVTHINPFGPPSHAGSTRS